MFLIVGLWLVCITPLRAAGDKDEKEGVVLGARVGPAIPGDKVSSIYDSLDFSDPVQSYTSASSLGYQIAANVRIGLSSAFSLSGGLGFVQFPGQELRLTDSVGRVHTFSTSTLFIPVTAGISWLPIKSLVVPIVHAEAMYSYRKVVVSDRDILSDFLKLGVELEPQTSRLGAQVGLTLEVNLGLRIQVDGTYAFTNLVGKEEGEPDNNFLLVGVGIMF
jgi:hypothetical protein